ncbi:MAG: tyrosine-type recombinase/integrase [Acidobacteriota bacterium]|nr:tyrosine-type recombinase/integrase [Acidobacteriota bacterium]
MKVRLTDRFVRGLRADGKAGEAWDTLVEGLCLRFSKTGRKSWTLRKRWLGQNRRWNLGKYPDVSLQEARARAREALAGLAHGEDPNQEKRDLTVRELVDRFDEDHLQKLKSHREVRRVFTRYVLPKFGPRPAASLTRRDVIQVLDQIAQRAPSMSNRVRAWISVLYNWALERDLVETSPVVGIRKRRERSRDRVLSQRELATLWRAWGESELHESTRSALRCLLATGQRPGEILRMERSQIDGACWRQPAGWTKSGRAHSIELPPVALEQIERCEHLASPFVFPSERTGRPLNINTLSRAARRVGGRVEISWRPHDLRRTVATWMGSQGYQRQVIARVLGHADNAVTAIYDRHRYDQEAADALRDWNAHLRTLTSQPGRR